MAVSQTTLEKYWRLQDEAKADVMPYKTEKKGRGIVICAGGKKYFTCAWVCVNVLRRLGCTLPIEFWHLGPTEMDDEMRELVRPLNVTCVDAFAVREQFPVRKLGGWELNPYSIIHSKFKEVIFLDADNVPLRDPAFFFDTPQYKESGAIFWPDYGNLEPHREIWKMCRLEYRDEPEFESGQIVVDTERCWKELQLTMHLNEYSKGVEPGGEGYYDHVHGDKETFHMAWHMWGTKYQMPSRRIHRLRATMCQHDFDDKRVFQHRNMDKWKLEGGNARIKGFEMEDLCFGFVRDLRTKWNGKVGFPSPRTPAGERMQREIGRIRLFDYVRVGSDKRRLELLPDNTIGLGAAKLEKNWYIRENSGKPELCIFGDNHLTCALVKGSKNQFEGKWEHFEQMPIELVPVNGELNLEAAAPSPVVPESTVIAQLPKSAKEVKQTYDDLAPNTAAQVLRQSDFEGTNFVYVRVGYDSRLMRTGTNGNFEIGADSLEKSWKFKYNKDGKPAIEVIDAEGNVTFEAERGLDNVWRGKWKRFEKMPVMLVEVP